MNPTRIFQINAEIDRLKRAIVDELARPAPDYLKLTTLKKRQLALKDRLWTARLTTTPRAQWI